MVWLTPRPGMIVTFGRAAFSLCFGINSGPPGSGSARAAAPRRRIGVPPPSSQAYSCYTFDVICLRKHVDRLHAAKTIAGAEEYAHVARQRGRVAGHVDDARRPERGERGHGVGRPGARRVEDDRV